MIKIINICIEGHDYSHDLFELVRAFFGEKEIKIIQNKDLIKIEDWIEAPEYLLVSRLEEDGKKGISNTSLYSNGVLVEDFKEDIVDIDISFYDTKRLQKLSLKKGVYNILSKCFNIFLPWGILTGIRPVKVVHELIDTSISNNEIINILEEEYKFISSKSKLILDVALSQREYIYPRDKEKFSLYINIPFCPSKCSYCSFPSFKIDKDRKLVEDYIDTLIFEITSSEEIFKNKKLNTIYVGGGTPTSLETFQLERIIKTIRDIFPEDVKEFTVEAGRPDTINLEKLQLLKKYGVNRISINPQTFNRKTLKTVGRNHDIESIKAAYNLAKSLDFDIINMDIILGLPGEGILELESTLNELEKLNPDNLTVHTLSLKRGSSLHESSNRAISQALEVERMLEKTISYSRLQGYNPYYMYRQKQILGNLENIGYAKPGKECIYNISMMEEKETILAFGLGAVTKVYYPNEDKIKRIANFKSLHDYIGRISELIDKKKDVNFSEY